MNARLRARILRALGAAGAAGIPLGAPLACGGAQVAPAPAPGPTSTSAEAVAIPTSSATVAEITAPSVPVACKVDEVHESFCGLVPPASRGGRAPFAWCASNAKAIVWSGDGRVVDRASIEPGSPALADYAFDPARTATAVANATPSQPNKACCYERCVPLVVKATARPKGERSSRTRCIPAPEAGTRFPAAESKACPAAVHFSTARKGGGRGLPGASPTLEDDAPFVSANAGDCCYQVEAVCPSNMWEADDGSCRYPERGRPLREQGLPVFAPPAPRADWLEAPTSMTAAVAGLTPETRQLAAARWAREGAAEHASVASFARLSLELMVLGAPADLVDAAHVAARDEIRHAALAYGLASSFGGRAVGPGPLPISTGPQTLDWATFAEACFLDGCVGETVAALSAFEAHRLATVAEVRDALAVIAEDEARHAELAYRILAFCIDQGGAPVRQRIADVASAVAGAPSPTAEASAEPEGFDAGLGLLSQRVEREVRERAMREVVGPCAAALLNRGEA